jgi:hypothetical protein
MLKHRLFNLLIAIALVIVIAFTVREVAATSDVTSQTEGLRMCHSLPSPYSIHSEYDETTGVFVIRTEDGPTGVDGGLKTLLSAYKTCSR